MIDQIEMLLLIAPGVRSTNQSRNTCCKQRDSNKGDNSYGVEVIDDFILT